MLRIGDDTVEVSGTAVFVAHMQAAVIKALQGARFGTRSNAAVKPTAKAAPKKSRRGKKGGGRRKGSKVINGKVYTAEQLKARPELLKRAM